MKFKLASAAAAVVLSATASQAADLARKAPAAVDYVKVCDTYGAGFFYIPGSDTCIKIGGYVRVQAIAGDGDFGGLYSSRTSDSFTTRSRFLLNVDARSQTDFGVLRAYGAVYTEVNSNSSNGTYLDKAYIQWGGLTAGYAASFFDFFTGYENHFKYGRADHDDSQTLLAYTFGLGNGVSATLSLEDSTNVIRTSVQNGVVYYAPNLYYANPTIGGNKAPDVVANINVTQAWGSAQVMGALHYNNGGYVQLWNDNGALPDSQFGLGKLDNDWGWAVGGGVKINLPMLGAGDQFGIQAVYADGAVRYASTGASGSPFYNFDLEGNTGKAWSVMAGLQHNWSPTWQSNLDVAYLDYNATSWGSDFSEWTAGMNLVWTPVRNLAITGAVEYKSVNYKSGSDQDAWAAALRIQRSF